MTKIRFKKLILNNFKVHNEFEIDFTSNKLYLVVGKNGSGKTSIIDGIFWCLYDQTVKGQRGDSIVNNKAKKDCSCILTFDVDDVEYEIRNYRKHTQFKNTKILLRNGIQISTDADVKETNDIISNIVMPMDLFSNCMLFSQFVKDPFLSRTHSGQKEILDKMLSLEKYDEYYDKINENISSLNNEILKLESDNKFSTQATEILTNNIEKLKSEFKDKTDNYINQKNQYNKDIKTHEKAIKELEKYQEQYEKLKNEQPKISEKYNKLNSEKELIKLQMENEKNSLDSKYKELFLNKSNEIKEKYDKIKMNHINDKQEKINKFNEYKQKYDKLNNDLINKLNKIENQIELDIKDIDNKIILEKTKLSEEFQSIQFEYNEKSISYNNKINEIKNQIYTIESEINKIQHEINLLNKSKNCTTCNREFDESTTEAIQQKIKSYEKDVQEKQIQINNLSNNNYVNELKELQLKYQSSEVEYKKNVNNISNKYNKNDVHNKYQKEIELIQNNIQKQNDTFHKSEANYLNVVNEIDSKINNIETDMIQIEIQSEKVNITNNYKIEVEKLKETYKNKLQKHENNIEICYNKLSEIEQTMHHIEEEYIPQIENSKNQINLIKSQLEFNEKSYESEKNLYDKSFKEINIEIKKYKDINDNFNKTLDEYNEKLNILNFWKKAFSDVGIKSILLDESIPILNKKAKELCQHLNNIRVSFSSQTTLKSGKSNNKFNIEAIHGINLSEYSDFSAGETRLANIVILLCLRHLLEFMSGKQTNIILLDEILDSLDEDNASVIAGIFEKLSKDYFVILISHTQKEWIQYDEELRL